MQSVWLIFSSLETEDKTADICFPVRKAAWKEEAPYQEEENLSL